MIGIWGSKQNVVGGKDGQVESSLMIKSHVCYVKTDNRWMDYKQIKNVRKL